MTAVLLAADAGDVTPGLLGFVVIALLGLATYFLIRSMNRQMRRIDLPDEHKEDDGQGTDDRPDRPRGSGG